MRLCFMKRSASMLRLALVILSPYFVSQVDAAQDQPSVNAEGRSPAAHFILIRIGISSAKTSTEYHYLVDLEKRETGPETVVEIPANETTELHRIRAQKMRHNEEAYKRIVEHFHNDQTSSSRNADLANALYWIERRSKAGVSRAYSIVASPDGTNLVHTADGEPLLLIDGNACLFEELQLMLVNADGSDLRPLTERHQGGFIGGHVDPYQVRVRTIIFTELFQDLH